MHFNITNGSIEFSKDKITIIDKAKKNNILQLLGAILWVIYGTISVLRYLKTGDQFLLWTGLFIGLGHLFILIKLLGRTSKSEISRKDISSIELKKRYNNKFLDIKLQNGKLRRVSQITDYSDELKDYLEKEFRPEKES